MPASPRGIALTVLVCAAALALSGCHWGSRHIVDFDQNPATSEWVVTIHQQQSAELIFECEGQNPGDPDGRAGCALDIIRWACDQDPINFPECVDATDHGSAPWFCRGNSGQQQNCATSMKNAITEVLGPQECIYFEYEVGGPSRTWAGLDSGTWGCP